MLRILSESVWKLYNSESTERNYVRPHQNEIGGAKRAGIEKLHDSENTTTSLKGISIS
jgi:hypothetical protein